MKMFPKLICLLCLSLPPIALAHEHCNIGALSQAQGTPLYFQNGGAFVTNSGFVMALNLDTNNYAGFYHTGDLTFTAIGQGYLNNPADYTDVRLRFVSVTGPAGGSFGVWDAADVCNEDDSYNSTTLSFSIPVGTLNGTNSIQISQSACPLSLPEDPFGHIHGRHYSVTKPGVYVVTVQAYDVSQGGPDGEPLHSPSELLPIYFQAGDQITALTVADEQVTATFPTKPATDYYLEATADLSQTNGWETVAGPFTATASTKYRFQTLTDANWNAPQRFYRMFLTPTP